MLSCCSVLSDFMKLQKRQYRIKAKCKAPKAISLFECSVFHRQAYLFDRSTINSEDIYFSLTSHVLIASGVWLYFPNIIDIVSVYAKTIVIKSTTLILQLRCTCALNEITTVREKSIWTSHYTIMCKTANFQLRQCVTSIFRGLMTFCHWYI